MAGDRDEDWRDLDELPEDHPLRRTWALYHREGLTPKVKAWCERAREVLDGANDAASRAPRRGRR